MKSKSKNEYIKSQPKPQSAYLTQYLAKADKETKSYYCRNPFDGIYADFLRLRGTCPSPYTH